MWIFTLKAELHSSPRKVCLSNKVHLLFNSEHLQHCILLKFRRKKYSQESIKLPDFQDVIFEFLDYLPTTVYCIRSFLILLIFFAKRNDCVQLLNDLSSLLTSTRVGTANPPQNTTAFHQSVSIDRCVPRNMAVSLLGTTNLRRKLQSNHGNFHAHQIAFFIWYDIWAVFLHTKFLSPHPLHSLPTGVRDVSNFVHRFIGRFEGPYIWNNLNCTYYFHGCLLSLKTYKNHAADSNIHKHFNT